jgi:hypothetical protein
LQAHHLNIATTFKKASRTISLVCFLLLIGGSAFSQNTKGDRPEGGSKGGKKENRFKLFGKKKQKKQPSYGKMKSRGAGRASSARRASAKPGKPKIYPQPATTQPSNRQRAWRGTASGSPLRVRSSTGQSRNIYPQNGPYVNNPSKKPRNVQRPVSNKSTLARLNRLQGSHDPSPPGKKKKIIPRSASKSFIARKSINVYANFPRPKKKGERATTRDLAGRKIRTKNYETPRPKMAIAPARPPKYHPAKSGDNPYRGPTRTYKSRTRTTPKAWTGDIAGRKIRGKNYSSKPKVEAGRPVFPPRKIHDRFGDRPYRGRSGGYESASKPGEKRTGISPNPVKGPGIGANGIGTFRGNIKGRKPLKGGGSVSGRAWNNNRTPVAVKAPGTGKMAAGFPGKIRRFSRTPGFADQGEGFTGVVRRRGKPLKGGGSVSGKSWNNRGTAVPVRVPGGDAARAVGYSGNIKARKPLKGGGSVSGKSWNNNGTPVPVRTPGGDAARAVGYSGNIKAGKPVKGGGSISGKLWNNRERAIPVRTPGAGAEKIGGYPGKMKRFSTTPGFSDQGEEFTGYIRRPRFWKDYIKNDNSARASLKKKRPTSATWRTGELQVAVRQRKYIQNKNAAETALPKQAPTKATQATGDLQVKVLQRKYVKNENAAENALRKQAPTNGTYATGGLQVKVKQKPYGEKPHAAEGSLPGIKPTKSSIKASEFSRSVRMRWDYIHNPSSSDQALKVREPGKAFAKATDYQGNIKVKKFDLFEKDRRLHPDARFVKTNKNNVDGERDLVTNFKLWWARLFKKQETQPEHLKDKGKKPRYDKGEAGMWYE